MMHNQLLCGLVVFVLLSTAYAFNNATQWYVILLHFFFVFSHQLSTLAQLVMRLLICLFGALFAC